ncbi:MAG: lipoyl synthase [Campylobacterota bacterium]|nr:lipoyl synthase [Campylobacterota bacterium]
MENKINRKPKWLQKKINPNLDKELLDLFKKQNINTVCTEAMCPNITECFSKKQATFLIMGNNCTRQCTFCAVTKDTPIPLDKNEPHNISKTVKLLGLKHVVITSPTRDDLSDGGAEYFYQTVNSIKKLNNDTTVELLIPDMKGDIKALEKIASSKAAIIGHNIETVPRLYRIRKGANYQRSLKVIEHLKELNTPKLLKSGLMLGLGEKDSEVIDVMKDLIDSGCRLLSIGQYLAPTLEHEKVVEFVKPEKFEYFKEQAYKLGFDHIESSPYTRSSYMAHEYLNSYKG